MGVMQWTKVPEAVWVEVPVIHEDAKYCKKEKKSDGHFKAIKLSQRKTTL